MNIPTLRGAIFESWVVAEIYKASVHGGLQPRLFHYREARGAEIDLLIEEGQDLAAIEIKSSATIHEDFFKNLNRFSDRMKHVDRPGTVRSHVVFGGESSQQRSLVQVLSWRHVDRLITT